MKEKNTFKSILGIAQEEIAILLGITRSQWAMHQTGRRKLPLHAVRELTRILQFTHKKEFNDKVIQNFMAEEIVRMQKSFEKEIQLNEYKIHVLGKKIKKAERLRNESMAALRLAEYLDMQTGNPITAGMSEIMKSQAMESLRRNNEILRKHIVSKETLKQQSKIIEMKLKDKEGGFFLCDS